MVDYPGDMNVKIAELEKLRTALEDLDRLPLTEQAAALASLVEDAKDIVSAVSARRGTVLAELTAPGGTYHRRIPALAAELGCHRSRIDEALKRRSGR